MAKNEWQKTNAKTLPAIHSITGCDSVSSFSGIGKKTAINILKDNINDLMDLSEFGDSPELSIDCDVMVTCIKFVRLLYDRKSTQNDLNLLRYQLFTQKSIYGDKLPPTLDSLVMHLKDPITSVLFGSPHVNHFFTYLNRLLMVG